MVALVNKCNIHRVISTTYKSKNFRSVEYDASNNQETTQHRHILKLLETSFPLTRLDTFRLRMVVGVASCIPSIGCVVFDFNKTLTADFAFLLTNFTFLTSFIIYKTI